MSAALQLLVADYSADVERDRLRLSFEDGAELVLTVRAEDDAAIDRMRFATTWSVELDGDASEADREWLRKNERACVEMWLRETRSCR